MINIPFEKSFASHPKSEFWDYEKNENMVPRMVNKSSSKKFWFNCDKCPHCFDIGLSQINNNSWCGYCASKKLCEDNNCIICFNKSFASVERSIYWDYEKNEKTPREVFKGSVDKFWFNCNDCNHGFDSKPLHIKDGSWCPYCNSGKVCDNENCIECFNRSFASHPKSEFWDYEKNEKTPRELNKNTHMGFWFNCNDCNHSIKMSLKSINLDNHWCKYCASNKLCDNSDCEFCFNKSFASHPKSEFWNYEKNEKTPRDIFKNNRTKYCFICENGHEFKMKPNSIVSNQWCPNCKNKTEVKVYEWLKKNYIVEFQKKYDDCKNIRALPFDFYIPQYNLIIELDGAQHFATVKHWNKNHIEVQKRDKYKMDFLKEQNISIIRIFQEDIYNNKIDWKKEFLENIKNYDIHTRIFISKNQDLYSPYKNM